MSDTENLNEATDSGLPRQALFDILLIQGALDSLGVALADHHHKWTIGERVIYEEATSKLTSWVDGCREIDSLASVKHCSLLPLLELHLRGDRASVQLLVSEYSLWRVASVASLLVVSTSYLRFRCFCSWLRIGVSKLLSNVLCPPMTGG